MTDQTEVKFLKKGEKIEQYFLLLNWELKTSRNGKDYLDVMLGDKSGSISGKMWEITEFRDLTGSAVVKVRGLVEDFQGSPQIKIDRIRPAEESDGINADDFLPRSVRNFDEMKNEFDERIDNIKNWFLKKLLQSVFTEEAFGKYSRVPAGKSWHHAYINGLLEHTLEIIKICELMCTFHPEINRDILVSGAMLHDFGKIYELSPDAGFEYTEEGKFLGHIAIAAMEVNGKIKAIEGFPELLRNQLLHLILSHQGKLEFASPVEPKTLEAIVLYQADELSAKTNAYKYAMIRESNSQSGWTKFLPLANNTLYVSENLKEKDEPEKDKDPETLFG